MGIAFQCTVLRFLKLPAICYTVVVKTVLHCYGCDRASDAARKFTQLRCAQLRRHKETIYMYVVKLRCAHFNLTGSNDPKKSRTTLPRKAAPGFLIRVTTMVLVQTSGKGTKHALDKL